MYHDAGLVVSNYFRSICVPCSLYIDDRHNRQLRVSLTQGPYSLVADVDQHLFLAARSAVSFGSAISGIYFGSSGIFSEFVKIYSGATQGSAISSFFFVNSLEEMFQMITEKQVWFLALVTEILKGRDITFNVLQKLVRKCVTFSLAIPAAILFTCEMNTAISMAQRTGKSILLHDPLWEEIAHWSFLDTWHHSLPWREERHICVLIVETALVIWIA